jgi:hypothetical protein
LTGFWEKLIFRVVLLWSSCGEVCGEAGKLTVFATRLKIKTAFRQIFSKRSFLAHVATARVAQRREPSLPASNFAARAASLASNLARHSVGFAAGQAGKRRGNGKSETQASV